MVAKRHEWIPTIDYWECAHCGMQKQKFPMKNDGFQYRIILIEHYRVSGNHQWEKWNDFKEKYKICNKK